MAKSETAAVKDPATKGKLKLIIVIVLALLLAIGASVGATWFFMHSAQSKPAEAADAAPVGKQPAIFEPMAPAFVANYNQNGRQRYMQRRSCLCSLRPLGLRCCHCPLPGGLR